MQGDLEIPRQVDIGKSMRHGRPPSARWDSLPLKRSYRDRSANPVTLATYVESRFIPQHVLRKTHAGRLHYHAILKHILNPEAVDRMFSNYMPGTKGRLKASPDGPYLDEVKISDLNNHHVGQLVSFATAQGYSPQTIKHIRNVLGAVISHAREAGLFSGSNPLSGVTLPPIVHRKVQNLTIPETKGVLRMMKFPEREIALMTITTGMSVSEVCALQWKHVNLSNSAAYSDGEVIPPRHVLVKCQRSNTYGDESPFSRVRQVEIPDPLLRRLIGLRRVHGQSDPDGFVWVLENGTRLCLADIQTRLEPIGIQLGIPWLSWPVLRRAHQALLSELRIQLCDELISAR
jgi:site-specific recombinase XerC